MINRLSFPSQNAHIVALKPVFARASRPIEYLVIAHNDPRLLKSLSSGLAGRSAAVLEVSQDTWDFDSGEFMETIKWALHQPNLRNVVLVGSSQSGGAASRALLVAAKPKRHEESNYAKLLAGVQRHQARLAELQQEFARHIHRLSKLPVIHSRWMANQLALHGLFYRFETGVFLRYDAETEAFELIGTQA